MDQLDMRFNDAVDTLSKAMPGNSDVKIVVDAAVASRNSATWPRAKVNEATLSSAVSALNDAAMNASQRAAAKIVIGAATESLPMNDLKRTFA
jgi:hypothetical protein